MSPLEYLILIDPSIPEPKSTVYEPDPAPFASSKAEGVISSTAFAESPALPIVNVPKSVAKLYLWSAPESPKKVPSVAIS